MQTAQHKLPLSCPELLAPAGDLTCVQAAVANGADAVYFGLDCGFNARARATNISLDVLPELMRYLRTHGVKGYVTLNTLVFPSELGDLEETVRKVAAAGADAVLVQDVGVVLLIRQLCPDLPIHASTQMTLTSADGIRHVQSLGVERVVLARELSVAEIAKIASETTMPLEVFVHGALCVAYSGQCMTSESLGGRSANRGQCAQACRLPYELVCDGADVNLGSQKYLLSPQDLAAYELVPDLIAAGVSAFKIEGRLKTPEYVANITRHYREAIDSAAAGQPVSFEPREVEEMELSFSRGFSTGWLHGCDHKALVPATSSAKRGVLLGEVTGIKRGRVMVKLTASVKRGDGIAFEGDRTTGAEQGGRVFDVRGVRGAADRAAAGDVVQLGFAHGALDLSSLTIGQRIWKTDDPELTRRLRKTFEGEKTVGKILPLEIQVEAVAGRPITIKVRAGDIAFEIASEAPLARAHKHVLSRGVLESQLGRLGGTQYRLHTLEAKIFGEPMCPLSVLGQLRHQMVHLLDEQRAAAPVRHIRNTSVIAALSPDSTAGEPAAPQLHVLCRSLDQLRTALDCGLKNVTADFQDIREYRQAVEDARVAGAAIWLATPRIAKPGEHGIFKAMSHNAADGFLVRNLSGVEFCREHQTAFVADFSLNATNQLTVRYLKDLGAHRITASYDLNRDQLLDVVDSCPPQWLEVVVHQHMPMFHMEHCVFCAVLSPGTNKTNCGRPCDRHEVRLRDRIGVEHALRADVGCRNTVFNAVPQSAAEVVPALLARGVRQFRIELLDDLPQSDLARLVELYQGLLAGQYTGKQVWTQLRAANRVGVTRGTLEERRNPLAII